MRGLFRLLLSHLFSEMRGGWSSTLHSALLRFTTGRGCARGSGSGKETVAELLTRSLGAERGLACRKRVATASPAQARRLEEMRSGLPLRNILSVSVGPSVLRLSNDRPDERPTPRLCTEYVARVRDGKEAAMPRAALLEASAPRLRARQPLRTRSYTLPCAAIARRLRWEWDR